jgi:hypothetical protein
MRGKAASLMSDAELHNQWYLGAPGGSIEALAYEKLRLTNTLDSAQLVRNSSDLDFAAGRSLGGKLPVVGLVITAAAVGYDIHEGKPASTAIVGGVGGVVGGVLGAAAVASAPISLPVIAVVAGSVFVGYWGGVFAEGNWSGALPGKPSDDFRDSDIRCVVGHQDLTDL